MRRRDFLGGVTAVWITSAKLALADASSGQKLADAARAQLGVTTSYDPSYTRLSYPGGDVPRSTGVCADVVIRGARDGLGLDLQKLLHEDMAKNFSAYHQPREWGMSRPDANIDHRRVINLETYWTRAGARLWAAERPTAGDGYLEAIETGDILTLAAGCAAAARGDRGERGRGGAGGAQHRTGCGRERADGLSWRARGGALSLAEEQLLIRQENSEIFSHPFPQKTRKWMGHPNSIELPDQ